jgi:hypothetical protein
VKKYIAVVLLIFTALFASAQNTTAQIKSWKSGNTQVQEQTLDLALNTAQRTYSKIVNDASGQPRFRLSIEPAAFIGPGDGILAWHVYLTGLDDHANLLTPSNDFEQEEFARKDYLWWFYPARNRLIDIGASRVIQVEGFYVVLKPGKVSVGPGNRLESMGLTVIFSNSRPALR